MALGDKLPVVMESAYQKEMAQKMGYMDYWGKPQSEVAALLSEPNFSRPYIVVANLWETAVWGSVVHKPPRAEVDTYTVYVSQFGSGVSQIWIGSGRMYSIVTAGQQWDESGWFAPPTQADMLNKANKSEVVNNSDDQEINGMKSFNRGAIRVGSPWGIYTVYNYLGQLYRGSVASDIGQMPNPSDFVDIATATSPEEHALPLAEGWTARRKTKFSVSQDSLVLVTFGVWGPANMSDRAVIAQLPPGFRPGELISTGCTVTDESTYTRYAAGLDVNRAGEVIVFSKQPGWSIAVGQVAFYTNV